MKRDSKKERIMAAAEGLFKTGQFHEITLDRIAKAADVGKGTIYEYFTSKDDLFFQTAIGAFDQIGELVREHAAAANGGSAEEQLRRICDAICTFAQERRPLFRLIQAQREKMRSKGGTMHQRYEEHRRKMVQAVAAVIRSGVERRQIRADISSEALAEYFLAIVRVRFNEGADLPERDRSPRTAVSLFVHGLKPLEVAIGHPSTGKVCEQSRT